MDVANKTGGFVVGTGDLSEAALGWMTFNGDHMSMYHVNAGVPKTLVRYLWWRGLPMPSLRARRPPSCTTSWPRRSRPNCCRWARARNSSRRPRRRSDPTSCTTSSSTTPCAMAVGPRKLDFLAGRAFAGVYEAATSPLDGRLLPPLLQPPVQALVDARRPQGRHRGAVAARRLAHAQRLGRPAWLRPFSAPLERAPSDVRGWLAAPRFRGRPCAGHGRG
jgi:hypothetical protein